MPSLGGPLSIAGALTTAGIIDTGNASIAGTLTVGGELISGIPVVGLFTSFAGMAVAGNVNVVRSAGYSTVGRGIADYTYDATVNAAFVLLHPRASFLAASGRGFRLNPALFQITQFGAVADDVTDDYPAFVAAFAYLKTRAFNPSTFYQGAPRLHVPGGTYYVGTTIQIKGMTLILEGDGNGQAGGIVTKLRFPASTTGIQVQRYNTLGVGMDSPVTKGGDASIIRNMQIAGGGGTPGALFHGIQLRARATIQDCSFTGFPHSGIYIVATAGGGGSSEGNVNDFAIARCQLLRNGVAGLYIDGPDANAGVIDGCSATYNGNYGFFDSSFLGNTYVGCHTSNNGQTVSGTGSGDGLTSQVYYGGNRYYLLHGQTVLGSTTTPGTDATVWKSIGVGTVHAWYPLWVSGTTYKDGSAYLSDSNNAVNLYLNCYSEGAQPASYIVGPAILLSGLHSADVYGGGIWLRGTTSGEMATTAGIVSSNVAGADTVEVALGGNPTNGDFFRLTATAAATNFWRLKANGFDLHFDYANSSSQKAFGITGPNTLLTFGRSSILPHAFYADRLMVGGGGNTSRRITSLSAAPTTGDWAKGDFCFNSTVTATGILAWSCTTAGTPGTWTPVRIMAQAAAQANSAAATVADLVTDFNALLAKLRTAAILAP